MRSILMAVVCGAAVVLSGSADAARRDPALSPQSVEQAAPGAKASRGVDPAHAAN